MSRRWKKKRTHPYTEADIARLQEQMHSEDELTRARAVRQICPCRMPEEVFYRLRKEAKRLQHDPSPLVRANARHIEEDARTVASIQASMERVLEYEEECDAPQKRDYRRRK